MLPSPTISDDARCGLGLDSPGIRPRRHGPSYKWLLGPLGSKRDMAVLCTETDVSESTKIHLKKGSLCTLSASFDLVLSGPASEWVPPLFFSKEKN